MIMHMSPLNTQCLPNQYRQVQGFSMLEVMIALLVISIGMLGMAAMQARSMRYNHDALVRSQATELINDIFEKMRARSFTADATAEATLNGYLNSAYTGTSSSGTCPTSSSNDVTAEVGCFREGLGKLPGGTSVTATITCSSTGTGTCADGRVSNNIYTVTIAWIDRETNSALATPLTISSQL
jgi:type IV pilus assembly protein PilV